MINTVRKEDCCGCEACALACGHDCITMSRDAEGFLYPQTDTDRCVDCGLCDKVCPIINVPDNNSVSRVLAVRNRDENCRENSSSGGVFSAIARRIITNGGVVAGCRLNDKMEAEMAIAEDMEALKALMSSKYVQSRATDIYRKVRDHLISGHEVLFVGVPCQVSALRNYLRKDYESLYTIDILCHGVPSPAVLADYVSGLENRYEAKMTHLNFRYKPKGWKRLHIDVGFTNRKRHILYSGYDSYMQLFLSDSLQRPSCFECKYNTTQRPGDLSLGDFWGIGRIYPERDDDKGISLVLINSNKGKILWERIMKDTDSFDSDLKTAIAGNKVLVGHLPSRKRRDEFYKLYTAEGFRNAVAKMAPEPSWLYQTYYNIMRKGLDFVRKVRGIGY